MTPSMEPSVPSGMNAELDALFAEGGTSESTTATAGSADAAGTESAPPTPPDTSAQPTEPPAPVEAKPEAQPDEVPLEEEIGEGDLREYRGKKEFHFAEEKGKRLLESHRFANELRQTIPDLTVEGAKAHYAAYADMQRLQNAIESGNPVEFMRHWLDNTRNNPDAFNRMAVEASNALIAVSPQTFETEVAIPIVAAKMEELQRHAFNELRNAQRSGDPKAIAEAYAAANAARKHAWMLTNKYLPFDGESASGSPEFAAERQQFEQERKAFEESKSRAETERRQTVEKDFEKRLETGTNGLIQRKVEAVSKYFASNPTFKPVTVKYLETVVKDRLAENKPWMDTYGVERTRALRTGSASDLANVEKRYLSRIESIVVSELQKMIPSETRAAVEKNQQRHAAAQDSQRREVIGNGKPAPQSIVTPPGKAGSRLTWEQELNALIPT